MYRLRLQYPPSYSSGSENPEGKQLCGNSLLDNLQLQLVYTVYFNAWVGEFRVRHINQPYILLPGS